MKSLHRKTKRLTLRPLSVGDFQAWRNAHLAMDRPKNKWDHGPKPEAELTRDNFRKFVKHRKKLWDEDKFYDFGVFDKKGTLVGAVALMEVSRGISHTAFLGYSIYNSCWQRGYGKEAVNAVIDIGFRNIKLHRIEAGVEPGNIRSIALARSLEMRREGLKKRAVFLRNTWVDLIIYTLTAEDVGIRFDTRVLTQRPRG